MNLHSLTLNDETLLTETLEAWARRKRLANDDVQSLRALPFAVRTVERDAYIVREGAEAVVCTLLLTGCAFRQKVVRSGARQIISFHFPSEFLDLQSCLLPVSDHSVHALGTCKIATVPKGTLVELLMARPAIGQAMWFDTLVEGAIFREWVVNVGRRNAKSKIAHLLCELALRLSESTAQQDGFTLPITQEQIADATGMTSVHTNRTIQALRKEGMISMSGGRLTVHDWGALRSTGDFSEAYLHRYAEPTMAAQQ